jgi:transitional endoplasmic reticulum ATPase
MFAPDYYDLLNRPLVVGMLLGTKDLPSKGVRYAKTIEAMVLDKQRKFNWSDFGGADLVKKSLMSRVIGPLINPKFYEALDLDAGNMILTGPPGTGKTLICNIMLNEVRECNRIPFKPSYLSPMLAEKVSVEYFYQWIDTITEETGMPSIVIHEEIDEIGSRFKGDFKEVSNAMLRILDGSERHNFSIVGTTNRPSDLDFAFYRPGRFYPVIYMGPPNAKVREEILTIYAERYGVLDKLNVKEIAARTEGFTGAHLKEIFDSAKHNAIVYKGKNLSGIKRLTHPEEIEIGPADVNLFIEENKGRIKKNVDEWESTFSNFFKKEKFEGAVINMFA